MAAKFMTLDSLKKGKNKNTVFTHRVLTREIEDTSIEPGHWCNVLFIGHDEEYGDVFKCWDNNPTNFTIFFGTKGDEFD